jgi:hypothetical protein
VAFPWIFHSNFAAGTNAEWDSESDTGARLDFPHYSALAKIPGMPAPYSGAYCMRIQMGDTNAHTLTEGDIDIADGATRYFRFPLFAASNVTATADDTFNIFTLQQAGGTVESTVGMRITAASNVLEIGIGDGAAPTSFVPFPRGRWVIVELEAKIHSTDEGTLTLFLDGGSAVALTTLDNAAAVGQGVLGTTGTLATTLGTLLFGEFIMDDARIYPPNERFPTTVRVTKSANVFVGPGCIDGATLLSANGTMDIYDTDTANINDAGAKKVELATAGNYVSNDSIVHFERGCYVALGGTNPYGEIRLLRNGTGGNVGPTAHFSDGAIRNYGAKRVDRPLNA